MHFIPDGIYSKDKKKKKLQSTFKYLSRIL